MSERSPHNPNEEPFEIENPLHFKCGGGDGNHITDHENTKFFYFEHDLTKMYVDALCDETEYHNIVFINYEDEEQVQWAMQFSDPDFIFNDLRDLPDNQQKLVMGLWENHYGIEYVKEYELTPGHESRLEHFRKVLENAPPGFVVAELVEVPQPPRKLNEYWPEKE